MFIRLFLSQTHSLVLLRQFLDALDGRFIHDSNNKVTNSSILNLTLNAYPANGELDMKTLTSVVNYRVRAIVHIRGQ